MIEDIKKAKKRRGPRKKYETQKTILMGLLENLEEMNRSLRQIAKWYTEEE